MNFRFIRTNDGLALKIDAATTDEIAALNELLLDRRMKDSIKPVVRVDNIVEGGKVKSIVVSQKCYLTRKYMITRFQTVPAHGLNDDVLEFYVQDKRKNREQPFFYFIIGNGRYCGFKIKNFKYEFIQFYPNEKAFRFFYGNEEVYYLKLNKKHASIQTLGDLNEFLK